MGSPAARSGCSSRKSSAQTESESSRPLRTPYIFEAFALSVIAHVLLLAWPLAVPGGSGLGIAAEHAAPASHADWHASTPESTALSKRLKQAGFKFIGPTTVYAAMQACGVVNDHLASCWVREAVETER